MNEQLFSDGIGSIAIIGGVVRIDLVALSPTEKEAGDNPRPFFSNRSSWGRRHSCARRKKCMWPRRHWRSWPLNRRMPPERRAPAVTRTADTLVARNSPPNVLFPDDAKRAPTKRNRGCSARFRSRLTSRKRLCANRFESPYRRGPQYGHGLESAALAAPLWRRCRAGRGAIGSRGPGRRNDRYPSSHRLGAAVQIRKVGAISCSPRQRRLCHCAANFRPNRRRDRRKAHNFQPPRARSPAIPHLPR